MTAPTVERTTVPKAAQDPQPNIGIEDLDITFIEAGGTVDHIIKMTNDGCGSTCQSACTSC
uniref:FxLD family lanthipeptide n=1 Tax=Paractinoplanes polyasparticus TaxID=2856853 RepID=UPI0027E0EDD3|nr:FxLD family lanthipeptide [Actinoplanes polyasparticus]